MGADAEGDADEAEELDEGSGFGLAGSLLHPLRATRATVRTAPMARVRDGSDTHDPLDKPDTTFVNLHVTGSVDQPAPPFCG